ncbi:MAG TPA: sigma 54-interacting transcriptional regulator [Blastocatellia bacterium]|nr:sigma 54-interacting transcriptional regulator [Blastocatellia bacterium]
MAESELFGHRRGAFTGAENNPPGLFRAAADGVLFLDEISELSPASQSRLLRVIQEKKVLSLGDDRERAVDVRIIAATNRNLDEMVRQGTFRADLHHRLNVLPLFLPPLRERSEDLRPLTEHLLRKWQALNPGTSVSATDAFIAALARLDFPGNVRELENLIRQVLINKYDSTPFDLCDLPPEILHRLSVGSDDRHQISISTSEVGPTLETTLSSLISSQQMTIDEALKHCECVLLKAVLETTGGNQTRAASLLGITPRSVYNKMRQHNLQPQQ